MGGSARSCRVFGTLWDKGMKKRQQLTATERIEQRLIERPRLLNRLSATSTRTTLIVAPAGYGKTTLLRQWLESNEARLYDADLSATDVAALARGIARAFSDQAPDAPRYVDEVLTVLKNPARDPDEVARAVLKAIPAPDAHRLVIDDYDKIGVSPPAERLVELLHESKRLELIIASRSRPLWATARRFMYGEISELDAEELLMTADEVAAVLGPGVPSADVLNQAKGWPAVIGLVARAEKRDGVPAGVSPMLYGFFADEIYNRASASVQTALLDAALLSSASLRLEDTLAEAAETGLAHKTGDRIGLHPLARSFLLEKIKENPDGDKRVQAAFERALRDSEWDDCFSLIRTFGLADELERLIAHSFVDLLDAGRIATLETFARSAADFGLSLPVVDLVEAEIAFRDGLLDVARTLAESAAEGFATSDPLRARALILAGTAAQLAFDLEDAYRLHRAAREAAVDRRDINAALWGECQALIFSEKPEMRSVARIMTRSAESAEERVRAAMAELQIARREGLRGVNRHGAAVALLPRVPDPRVRTSFGNIWSYVLFLQAGYAEAAAVVSSALDEVRTFGLSFARPHLEWTMSAAALGLRRFSQADALLRDVEEYGEEFQDRHHQLNARALRARILLAQGRPEEAVGIVSPNWDDYPSRIMYGEYIATRALALSVAGKAEDALQQASLAVEMTSAIETRALARIAEALATRGTAQARAVADAAFAAAASLAVWDPLVIAFRAVPELLETLAADREKHRALARVLRGANDEKLARRCGLGMEVAYGRRALLSQREHEVFDLVCQGLKNREIAKALFIEESTVKAHLRHVYEKFNVRTRAEAVARHAEIADGAGNGVRGSS
jgi:LuxR family maltose regulon positive regulatory protein